MNYVWEGEENVHLKKLFTYLHAACFTMKFKKKNTVDYNFYF